MSVFFGEDGSCVRIREAPSSLNISDLKFEQERDIRVVRHEDSGANVWVIIGARNASKSQRRSDDSLNFILIEKIVAKVMIEVEVSKKPQEMFRKRSSDDGSINSPSRIWIFPSGILSGILPKLELTRIVKIEVAKAYNAVSDEELIVAVTARNDEIVSMVRNGNILYAEIK